MGYSSLWGFIAGLFTTQVFILWAFMIHPRGYSSHGVFIPQGIYLKWFNFEENNLTGHSSYNKEL